MTNLCAPSCSNNSLVVEDCLLYLSVYFCYVQYSMYMKLSFVQFSKNVVLKQISGCLGGLQSVGTRNYFLVSSLFILEFCTIPFVMMDCIVYFECGSYWNSEINMHHTFNLKNEAISWMIIARFEHSFDIEGCYVEDNHWSLIQS